MNIRPLRRDEIERVWEIDRREIVENVYYLRDGALAMKRDYFHIQGWPPGQQEHVMPVLLHSHDRGGALWGAFESDEIVGAAAVDNDFTGAPKNTLQLLILYVSRNARKRGVGTLLFTQASDQAQALGAEKLYISATPSENTVNFYLRRGCVLATEPDPKLLELEPEDIHLEFAIP